MKYSTIVVGDQEKIKQIQRFLPRIILSYFQCRFLKVLLLLFLSEGTSCPSLKWRILGVTQLSIFRRARIPALPRCTFDSLKNHTVPFAMLPTSGNAPPNPLLHQSLCPKAYKIYMCSPEPCISSVREHASFVFVGTTVYGQCDIFSSVISGLFLRLPNNGAYTSSLRQLFHNLIYCDISHELLSPCSGEEYAA